MCMCMYVAVSTRAACVVKTLAFLQSSRRIRVGTVGCLALAENLVLSTRIYRSTTFLLALLATRFLFHFSFIQNFLEFGHVCFPVMRIV